MKGIVDRIENNYIVVELEDKQMINIDKNKVPKEVREGYALIIEDKITIDFKRTRKLQKEIEQFTKDMWKD